MKNTGKIVLQSKNINQAFIEKLHTIMDRCEYKYLISWSHLREQAWTQQKAHLPQDMCFGHQQH